MPNYRISFYHNGVPYKIERSLSPSPKDGYTFEVAYRTEIRSYMNRLGLEGNYDSPHVEKI